MATKEKNHWHPAFLGAMGIELKDNRSSLIFEDYKKLSKEPLEIDLLIIEKAKGLTIKNEIGSIFRQFNIVEYKSPGDDMNITNYVKTVGYACILKGTEPHVDDIPLSEMTITMMREEYPEALFQSVENEGGSFKKKVPGIYYVYGLFCFPTQVIVTRELEPNLHPTLRVLSRSAKETDVEAFLKLSKSFTATEDKQNAEWVFDVSYKENKQVYDTVKRRNEKVSDAMREFMKKEIQEEREKGDEQRAVNDIKSLMETLKLTANQAMDALKIPASEQNRYVALL